VVASILYEDGKPIRAFKGDSCIYNAYRWAHKNFYLYEEGLPLHKLPDWLEVKFYILSEEQFTDLVK